MSAAHVGEQAGPHSELHSAGGRRPTVGVLVGSARANSLNLTMARALPSLAPKGMQVEFLPLSLHTPIFDEDLEARGTPPAINQLADAIAAVDGLVIVTPEYNYSVPGGLKNLIDWLSRAPGQPLRGKPVAIQSASMSGLGGVRAQYHLRQILVYLDARVLNHPEVMIGAAHSKIDAARDQVAHEPTRQLLREQLQAFADFIGIQSCEALRRLPIATAAPVAA